MLCTWSGSIPRGELRRNFESLICFRIGSTHWQTDLNYLVNQIIQVAVLFFFCHITEVFNLVWEALRFQWQHQKCDVGCRDMGQWMRSTACSRQFKSSIVRNKCWLSSCQQNRNTCTKLIFFRLPAGLKCNICRITLPLSAWKFECWFFRLLHLPFSECYFEFRDNK